MTGEANRQNDIASQLTRKVEQWVGLLHDHTARPILYGAAVAVVAVAGAVLALAVLTLLGIALIKLFNQDVFGGRVWATDFAFGGILSAAGLFLLRMSMKARRSDAGS